jgi:hypothetical protein
MKTNKFRAQGSTTASSTRISINSILCIIVLLGFGLISYLFLSDNIHVSPSSSLKMDKFQIRRPVVAVNPNASPRNLFKPVVTVTKSSPPVITEKRKRYAYAITITKDGFFQDGAAVLMYSIMKYSYNASYDISFIAFVHPNVTTSRPGLEKLGWHVIEVPIPVNVSAIKFDFLREKINKNGCCGSSELIKLTSYR